ncbi:hypothetical protein BaRGS_00021819, partial [Batillaria attramentaria]
MRRSPRDIATMAITLMATLPRPQLGQSRFKERKESGCQQKLSPKLGLKSDWGFERRNLNQERLGREREKERLGHCRIPWLATQLGTDHSFGLPESPTMSAALFISVGRRVLGGYSDERLVSTFFATQQHPGVQHVQCTITPSDLYTPLPVSHNGHGQFSSADLPPSLPVSNEVKTSHLICVTAPSADPSERQRWNEAGCGGESKSQRYITSHSKSPRASQVMHVAPWPLETCSTGSGPCFSQCRKIIGGTDDTT